LQSGRRVLNEAPHVSFSAGLAILTVVLGFNLVGDGLRDLLDPRRARNKV
jgi:peptide/nickel transport system permease protein